jgi:bifunctional UDP-N-acetylglucosamine pyrophosphorylase/glucosamine-1-phosphate N-acetyltransferase
VVRDSGGEVSAIIEAKDANAKERTIREVNTGIYCASADLLRAVLPEVENANVQGEYYLTDLVRMSAGRGWKVQAVTASDPIEFLGVNTEDELKAAEKVISQRMGHRA